MRKKFKYKKSHNDSILATVLKVVQDKESKKDNIYSKHSKQGLINYLSTPNKDGKITCLENNNIQNCESLKHIIISPVKPSRWEKLNKDEKETLRHSFISKLQTDLQDYPYLLAIESKSRDNEGKSLEDMEHYHIAISSDFMTTKNFKYKYRLELMENYVENHSQPNTRKKLGIRTKEEAKEEKIEKIKAYHAKKEENKIKQKELSLLFSLHSNISGKKESRYNLHKNQKYHINKNKANLFLELNSIKKSMNNSVKHIKNVSESIEDLELFHSLFTTQLHSELTIYRKNQLMSMNDYTYYTKSNHSYFVKTQDYLLQNKSITKEQFLTAVSRNKNFWKDEEKTKRRSIEYDILKKQQNIKYQLDSIVYKLQKLYKNKSSESKILELLHTNIDFTKFKIKNETVKSMNADELLTHRLKIYNAYRSYVSSKISSTKSKQTIKGDFNYEREQR